MHENAGLDIALDLLALDLESMSARLHGSASRGVSDPDDRNRGLVLPLV
jgi:hypothetical protein